MAEALNLSLKLQGNGRRQRVAAGGTSPSDSFAIGNGDWPALNMILTLGTSDTPAASGIGYANAWYVAKRTCTAAGSDNLDLTALTNNIGETFNFAKIKKILIALTDINGAALDGVGKLLVGPQNITNAFQGPFGGGGATVYKSVYDWEVIVWNKWAGYTVDGTHKILGITNPGANDISYAIGIWGVHA